MPRPLATAAALLIVASCGVVVSCGGGDKAANKSSPAASDGPAATLADGADGADGNGSAGMPAECVPAPYTVVAQRDGEQPAGSATFGVVGAAALPIPLVPNKAGSLTDAEAIAEGATTDLLGYVVFFGDEEFGPDDVSMFGGYAPETGGAARGAISIFPHTTAPLVVGDVLTPGTLDGLDMTTTLNRVLLDVKFAPDEFTSYLNDIEGDVTILGLTSSAICVDVNLQWEYSKGSQALGTLKVNGIFTAALAPRSLPFN